MGEYAAAARHVAVVGRRDVVVLIAEDRLAAAILRTEHHDAVLAAGQRCIATLRLFRAIRPGRAFGDELEPATDVLARRTVQVIDRAVVDITVKYAETQVVLAVQPAFHQIRQIVRITAVERIAAEEEDVARALDMILPAADDGILALELVAERVRLVRAGVLDDGRCVRCVEPVRDLVRPRMGTGHLGIGCRIDRDGDGIALDGFVCHAAKDVVRISDQTVGLE